MSSRVVIITGASDGIGAELARQLAQAHGGKVSLVLAARSQDKLAQVAQQCRTYGSKVLVRPTDVSHEADCRALIAETMAQYGRINTLVNNAGMSAHASLSEVTDLHWYEQLMRINFWGSAWCTHAALPYLKVTRGRIVAVSSLAGLVGVPGRTAYSATKFAMTGFFEALRIELAPQGISVTLAYPGVVATDIRARGFNAHGQAAGVSSLDEAGAMSVAQCARLIRVGMARRDRDIVMSVKGKLSRWLKLLAPRLLDKLVTAALRRDLRPD